MPEPTPKPPTTRQRLKALEDALASLTQEQQRLGDEVDRRLIKPLDDPAEQPTPPAT